MYRLPVFAAACVLTALASAAGACPDTDALAEITIAKRFDGTAPVHWAPSGWTCGSSDTGSVYTVSCTPTAAAPSGNWVCPHPEVFTSYIGSPLDTLDTSTTCGAKTVSCSPQAAPSVAGFCSDSTAGPGAVPFVCVADYSGVTAATVEWTVLCRSYH